MCQLIEKIANEKGINVDDANYIFAIISAHLLSKIPALNQVIDDIFENADEGILKEHVSKAVQLIQEQLWKEKFKDCHGLPQTYINRPGYSGGELF